MSLLLHVSSAQAPSNIALYVIAAALTGGLIPAVISAYRRMRRGPIEDEEVVGRIVRGEVSGMKDLLGEYRVEVEVTKRQVEEYRKQLIEITRDLAQAQVRISRLEDELKESRSGRERLRHELEQLVSQRDGLTTERDRLATEASTLRARVQSLEEFERRINQGAAD